MGDGYVQDDFTGEARIAGIGFYNRDLEIKKNYRLWDQGRLYPLGVVTFCSFLLMLFIVGVAEWMDSSLKTEQQASRYLDLPVLGSFPISGNWNQSSADLLSPVTPGEIWKPDFLLP